MVASWSPCHHDHNVIKTAECTGVCCLWWTIFILPINVLKSFEFPHLLGVLLMVVAELLSVQIQKVICWLALGIYYESQNIIEVIPRVRWLRASTTAITPSVHTSMASLKWCRFTPAAPDHPDQVIMIVHINLQCSGIWIEKVHFLYPLCWQRLFIQLRMRIQCPHPQWFHHPKDWACAENVYNIIIMISSAESWGQYRWSLWFIIYWFIQLHQ